MFFYTSELMFGNSLYLSKGGRHFPTALHMNNYIIDCWNRVVSDSDDVFILGGVGDFEYLKSLNGNKRLVMSEYELNHFKKWRNNLFSADGNELEEEIYDKYLLNTYGVKSVNHSGRLIRRLSTGRFVRLVTNKSFASKDIFTVYGCIGDFQKMTSYGINASVGVNNYYPISETELEYYYSNTDKAL